MTAIFLRFFFLRPIKFTAQYSGVLLKFSWHQTMLSTIMKLMIALIIYWPHLTHWMEIATEPIPLAPTAAANTLMSRSLKCFWRLTLSRLMVHWTIYPRYAIHPFNLISISSLCVENQCYFCICSCGKRRTFYTWLYAISSLPFFHPSRLGHSFTNHTSKKPSSFFAFCVCSLEWATYFVLILIETCSHFKFFTNSWVP